MIRRPAGLLTVAALAVAGCSTPPASTGPDEEILVLEVAAETRTCVGEMEQECLQVRAPGEEAWSLFYDTIEGFDREPGVRYVLEVARRTVERPPADASSYAYRLIRVLEREPAGAAAHGWGHRVITRVAQGGVRRVTLGDAVAKSFAVSGSTWIAFIHGADESRPAFGGGSGCGRRRGRT